MNIRSRKQKTVQPVFKSGQDAYMIDTCRPQISAARQGLIEFHALTSGSYPGKRLPKGALPGLSSIGWWNAKGAPDWGLEPHRNEGIEVVFLETGSMPFIVNGRKHRIQSGDLTITRPWDEHKLGNPNIGPGKLHWFIIDLNIRNNRQPWNWPEWIILDDKDLKRLTKTLNSRNATIISSSGVIRRIFRSLAEAVASKGRISMSTIAVRINELLLEILRGLSGEKADKKPSAEVSHKTILNFLTELERSPDTCSQPWTLNSMAEHCRTGTTFFVERCRETVNESPMKYLNDCRLKHARNLLESGKSESVTETALAAGFSSSQYFATCFRKKFGHTPSTLHH